MIKFKHVFAIFLTVTSCIVGGPVKIPQPTPTILPTPRQRLTAIPPFQTVTPMPTARPFILKAPSKADQCEKFQITIKGPFETDDIVVWAEQQYHIGRMFYDESKDEKYMNIKLNISGERTLDFKINGVFEMSHKILIAPHPENCVLN